MTICLKWSTPTISGLRKEPVSSNGASPAKTSKPREKSSPSQWRRLFEQEQSSQIVIAAALAWARRAGDKALLYQKLAAISYKKLPAQQRLAYLRALSLAAIRLGPPAKSAPFLSQLEAAYPAGDNKENSELCRLLVYLDSPQVISKSLFLMQSSVAVKSDLSADLLRLNDRYGKSFQKMLQNQPDSQGLHYALMLMSKKSGWSQSQARQY